MVSYGFIALVVVTKVTTTKAMKPTIKQLFVSMPIS